MELCMYKNDSLIVPLKFVGRNYNQISPRPNYIPIKKTSRLGANLKGNSRGSLELQKCDLVGNGPWLLQYSGCLSC